MRAGESRVGRGALNLLLAVIAASLIWQAWLAYRAAPRLASDTPFQAVLLTSGEAYYGRLRAVGPSFIELADVYYVKRRGEGGPGGASVALVKRGAEWHAPERMYINTAHVLLLEPVAPESSIGRAIVAHERAGGAAGEFPLE